MCGRRPTPSAAIYSMSNTLMIGVSARIHHPLGPSYDLGNVYTKTLHYMEQSIATWITKKDVVVVIIPGLDNQALGKVADIDVSVYANLLDALVLQPGADISPQAYGEQPIIPEWSGDSIRDRYELDLFNAFVDAGKPVLGICRGCQLINVALGGTLYQDIPTQLCNIPTHRDATLYERILHDMEIVEGTGMANMYPGIEKAKINSIHHQAVKDVGRDLTVEARSTPDGIVEAIRWQGPSYVFGVQWHPEFMANEVLDDAQLEGGPILEDFISAVRIAKSGKR